MLQETPVGGGGGGVGDAGVSKTKKKIDSRKKEHAGKV
jgi:hypothetical protein